MAFISKQEIQGKKAKLKEICKKYNIKASFSGSGTCKLICTIQSGSIDFNEVQHVNHYYINEHWSGVQRDLLNEIYSLMKEGWYDNSDIMTDYFNTAWYNQIRIGTWDKPYRMI